MSTVRKSIDLEEEVVKVLQVAAATKGLSLKRFMEEILQFEGEKLKTLKVEDLVRSSNKN